MVYVYTYNITALYSGGGGGDDDDDDNDDDDDDEDGHLILLPTFVWT